MSDRDIRGRGRDTAVTPACVTAPTAFPGGRSPASWFVPAADGRLDSVAVAGPQLPRAPGPQLLGAAVRERDTRIAGVTQLHTNYTSLDLGRSFHYACIQLFPGVWRGDPDASVDRYVGEPYEGDLPLIEVGTAAATADFVAKTTVFSGFVETLLDAGGLLQRPLQAL